MASDHTRVFIYSGQHLRSIPDNISHVRVDSVVKAIGNKMFRRKKLVNIEFNEGLEIVGAQSFSYCNSLESIILPSTVKSIDSMAFRCCLKLMNVHLNEGLETIDKWAFQYCILLESVIVPSTVRVLGDGAFKDCAKLRHVQLNEGLTTIGEEAFSECKSLERILIPSTVEKIEPMTFSGCTNLVDVRLIDGMKSIGNKAFYECTSLERVVIPSTVLDIGYSVFAKCRHLVAVEFSDRIQNLVSTTSLQNWWSHGLEKNAFETYLFLSKKSVPERFGKIQAIKWRSDIDNMLGRIPSLASLGGSAAFVFRCIDAKLKVYEELADVATLLELALWKSNCGEQSDLKMQEHRINCGAEVIIPKVLTFLLTYY